MLSRTAALTSIPYVEQSRVLKYVGYLNNLYAMNVRKRDRLFAKLGQSHLLSAQSPQPQPQGSTAPTGNSPSTSTLAKTHRNQALELAIQRKLDKLPESEKNAFQTASKNIDERDLLARIREHDVQHAHESSFRPQAERLSKLLRVLDRFMGGVAIGIQANPELSAIIVGGIRIVIDLAIDYVEFFSKLTDMLCQFEDYLAPLAGFAEAGEHSSIIVEALAGAYADILDFCNKVRNVFVSSDGKRKTWTSWRVFLRQQWEPFEIGFGPIRVNMQHHIVVLGLAGHVQQLSNDQKKEREDLLNWVSPHDHEEAHDNIYTKKHPGTGDWLLHTKEFQAWIDNSTSALLWCHGKRELNYKARSVIVQSNKQQLALVSRFLREWTHLNFRKTICLISVQVQRVGTPYGPKRS
jgi:hypothetical protein